MTIISCTTLCNHVNPMANSLAALHVTQGGPDHPELIFFFFFVNTLKFFNFKLIWVIEHPRKLKILTTLKKT